MSPLLSLVPAAAELGLAGYQAFRADDILDDLNRPVKQIQPSASKALAITGNRVGNNMPGYQDNLDLLDTALANANKSILGASGSSVDAVGGIVEAAGRDASNKMALSARNASFKDNALMDHKAQLDLMAEYENDLFNFNEVEPYNIARNAASAYGAGAMQNAYNGITNATSALILSGQHKVGEGQNKDMLTTANSKTPGTGVTLSKYKSADGSVSIPGASDEVNAYFNELMAEIESHNY